MKFAPHGAIVGSGWIAEGASRVQFVHEIDRCTLGKALFHIRAKINLVKLAAGIAVYLKGPQSKLDGSILEVEN
jgi:hypothetical protein